MPLPILKNMAIKTTTNLDDIIECTVIFLSLPGTKAVTRVLLDPDGLLGRLKPGQAVIDLSTIDYIASTEMASAFTGKRHRIYGCTGFGDGGKCD